MLVIEAAGLAGKAFGAHTNLNTLYIGIKLQIASTIHFIVLWKYVIQFHI